MSTSRLCNAAERLVNSTRGERFESEAFLARESASFMPFMPPWPGVQVTRQEMSFLSEKRMKKEWRKRIEAVCEGWGDPSKIFSIAEAASEKI